MSERTGYHIGFGREDLGADPPSMALVCGDPARTEKVACSTPGLHLVKQLSDNRALSSYLVSLADGKRLVCATSGMGAPSMSIVINELFSAGIRQVIRIGTTGSIQDDVRAGSVIIASAALCRQGAGSDIAPPEYPAAASVFLTAGLVEAARELGVDWHLGITASVDTFYEGQERTATSANKHLLGHLRGITEEYRRLNILSYEMETGTLFKMAGVYGFAAASVLAVIAERSSSEEIRSDLKGQAEHDAIRCAIRCVETLDPEYLTPRYWR